MPSLQKHIHHQGVRMLTTVESSGAALHVETNGDTSHQALMLWPSGSSSLHVWDHLAPRLAETFHVLRFDIRGVGRSTAAAHSTSDQFTFEQYAEDACRVLDHLGIDACHVWSQSWGSRPAIAFSALHPERVLSAAFYAANTDLPDVPAQREGTRRAADRRQAAGIEAPPIPAGMGDHNDPTTVPLAMQALRKFDLAAVIRNLAMPTLVATGDHDPNLTSSRQIAETAPNARLVELEDVGHNAILEHPELALRTFLTFHADLA